MFRFKNSNSISGQIHKSTSILLIGILVIFVFITSIINLCSYALNALNVARSHSAITSSLITAFDESVNENISSIVVNEKVSGQISEYYQGKKTIFDIRSSITDYVIKTLGVSDMYSGIDIVLLDGEKIQASDYFVNLPNDFYEDLTSREEYKAYQWYGPIQLSHNRRSIEDVFVIEKRIMDMDTYKELGMMYLFISEESFAKLYDNAEFYNDTKYFFTDENGVIFSTLEKELIGEKFEYKDYKNGYVGNLFNGGLYYMVNNEIGRNDMTFTTMIPVTSLFGPLFIQLAVLILLSVIGVRISIKLSDHNSEKLTLPITSLATTMNNISQGERQLRVFENASEEFNMLNKAFNGLMDSNDALIAEINKKHDDLRYYEYLMFQDQIKPHFLYNTLSNISALVKLNMKEDAINTVESLAKFLRLTLTGSNDEIALWQEVQIIENYFNVQQIRFQKKLTINFDIAEGISQVAIPKLTIQPIVENVIYHGMGGMKTKISIDVTAWDQGDNIFVVVKDDGIGMNAEKLEEIRNNICRKNVKNFGLTAVNQKLMLRYGSEYQLNIDSEEGEYTQITVSIPKNGGKHV